MTVSTLWRIVLAVYIVLALYLHMPLWTILVAAVFCWWFARRGFLARRP